MRSPRNNERLAEAAPQAGGTARIEGYDLARALAIFGMVVVNFKVVMGAGGWTTDTPAGPAWLQSLTGLLDGRAAATFVVLAGVGVALGARRAVASGDPSALSAARKTLWKRAAFLFFGGLLFATVWEADILHFYGWYIGLGALLIAFPNRRLLAVAALLVVAFPILLATFTYDAEWNLDTLAYEGFWTPAGQARHLFFNGFHPVVPWLAFLLLGIWLGRRNVAHVLIGMGGLSAVGRLENQSLPFAIAASAAFYALAIAFAVLWRKRFARGPLEWVMRKASG